MTSDAKVGLLLGLIFIFVIAFIINGLPNLRGQTNQPDIPKEMTELADASPGIAARERQASETLNWQELLARQNFGLEQLSPPAAEASADDVRFMMPLPQPEMLSEAGSGQTGQLQPTVGLPERIAAQEVIEQMRAPGDQPAGPGESDRDTRPKVCVVADGDTLAKIAQKFYGADAGNKLVNVTRIFEANRRLLKSPDELSIGQRLVIPPLPVAAAKKGPQDVLPAQQFEVVPSVGTARGGSPAAATTDGQWHVVRDGDSLWKIAASRLGNGARYKEIMKLNASLLPNEDTLSVGMRLRLPAQ